MNNKYEFMRKILRDKRLTADMRERVFRLMGGEVGGCADTNNLSSHTQQDYKYKGATLGKMNTRVEINKTSESNKTKDKMPKSRGKPTGRQKTKIHSPNKVRKWLYAFTINNSAIKYTVHKWDKEDLYTSFDKFAEQLNDEWVKKEFWSMQFYCSNLFWSKIFPFVFQKKTTKQDKKDGYGWGTHKIKVGWQYPGSVKRLYEVSNMADFMPQDIQVPEELLPSKRIKGRTIQTFGDVIAIFKDEIEFRDNNLYIGIEGLAKKKFKGDIYNSLDLSSLKGCSFYTNTEYVLKAFGRVFEMIKSRSTSTDIRVSAKLDQSSEYYHILVEHRNSYSYKEIDHPKVTLVENSGDMHALRTTLISLCDFSIISKFKVNGQMIGKEVKYLYEGVEKNNWQPNVTEPTLDVTGFTFLFKFPC